MSLPNPVSAPAMSGAASTSKRLEDLKLRVHRQLLERLDLVALSSLDSAQAEEHIRSTLQRLLQADSPELSGLERERLIEEVGYEVFGLGPLEEFLKDGDISDILVNGPGAVYIEKQGRLSLTDVKFRDEAHLMKVIDRIVSTIGRRLDRDSPMVDARLPDGSRVNAIVAPLAIRGPCLSIRRFGRDPYRIDNLLAFGALTPQMRELSRIDSLEERKRLTKARLIAFTKLAPEQRQLITAARRKAFEVDRGVMEADQKLVDELLPTLDASVRQAYPQS